MLRKLENWTEVSRGYYRYAILPGVAYEIFVEYWGHDTPIETAKASLCLYGEWREKTNKNVTEREWLGKELPIQELLNMAYIDNQENNLN